MQSKLTFAHQGIPTGALQRMLPRQSARKYPRLTVAAGNEDRAIDPHSTDLLASLAECPEEAQHAARDDCDNSWTPDVITSTWAPNWPYRIEGTMSNIVERRNTSNASVLEPQPSGSIPKKRGRPKGHAAWNRGSSMPEKTRAKISAAQKKRWQNPALQAHQRNIQKGKSAWNKGVKLSPEVKSKMSAAKRLTVLPKAMKYRISQSHLGCTHSTETRAQLSRSLTGRPKSEEHKKAIAAGQRRRFAARNLFNYIQACDQGLIPQQEFTLAEAGLEEPVEEPSIPSEPFPVCSGPAAPNMFSAGDTSKARKKPPGQSSPNDVVVQGFVAQLREFRALQQELAPWTDKFKAKHGRRPRFEDVENTGIGWLIEKYKEYVLTRQKLLCETGQLRSKLETSPPASQGCASYQAKMNSNSSAIGAGKEGAQRMARALEYKQSKKSAHVPSASHSESATAHSASSLAENLMDALRLDSPEVDLAVNSTCEVAAADSKDSQECEPAASLEQTKKSSPPALENAKNLAGASPRVRAAMLAAAKYKNTKKT